MSAEPKSCSGLTWKYLPVDISAEDIVDAFQSHLALSRPDWQGKQLEEVAFGEGITNKLVGLRPRDGCKQDLVLVRINGNNTELFINRELEVVMMMALNGAGLSPPLYYQFKNGLCYGFAPGRTLRLEETRDLAVAKPIAKTLAKLHSLPIPEKFQRTPRLYEFYDNFLEKITGDFGSEEKNKQ